MAGTLVIGCGSTGRNVASRLSEEGFSSFTIDWTMADLSVLPPGGVVEKLRTKYDFVHEQLTIHRNEIMLNIRGASQIILIVSLGGALGSASVNVVSGCARELGIRIVSIMTVPLEFEEIRRSAVLYALPSLVTFFDRTFILDLQCSGLNNMKVLDWTESLDTLCMSVTRLLARIMENGPFTSTFTANVYTLSRGEESSVLKSYASAESRPMFDRTCIKEWSLIVYTDGNPGGDKLDVLAHTVADKCGIVPQVITGNGDGTGVIVFFPVSL